MGLAELECDESDTGRRYAGNCPASQRDCPRDAAVVLGQVRHRQEKERHASAHAAADKQESGPARREGWNSCAVQHFQLAKTARPRRRRARMQSRTRGLHRSNQEHRQAKRRSSTQSRDRLLDSRSDSSTVRCLRSGPRSRSRSRLHQSQLTATSFPLPRETSGRSALAGSGSRVALRDVAINRHIFSLQVLVEPSGNCFESFYSVPRLTASRKLVRLTGKTNHRSWTMQKLERTEELLASTFRRSPPVCIAQYEC